MKSRSGLPIFILPLSSAINMDKEEESKEIITKREDKYC